MYRIFEKVKEIITKAVGVDASDIDMDQDIFNDLDLDSLDLVDICCGVESEFEIEITDAEFQGIETVEDLVELIRKKGDAA